MHVRDMSRMAMMSAAIVVGRLVFSGIPNIQPMTVLVILYALVFGRKEGILVGTMSLVISNLYLGFGPWTLAQVVGYIGIVLGTQLVVWIPDGHRMVWAGIYAGMSGLFYGMVVSLVHALFFGWNILIPYYIAGIPYDFAHALGNIGFVIILYPVFIRLFSRQTQSTLM